MSHQAGFAVRQERRGSAVLLRVQGELDFATAPILRAAVRRSLDEGCPLVLDLSLVTFLDSSGLATLLTVEHWARARGGEVALLHASAHLERRLRRMGALSLFPLLSADEFPEPELQEAPSTGK